MISLYHFTSRYHLPLILQTGLSRGDVPLSPFLSTQAVNLTREGRAHKQKYNATSYFLYMGERHRVDKAEIRITIEFNPSDPLLIHWPKIVSMTNMQKSWTDHLHRRVEDNGQSWYLYFGTIQPERFKIIEYNSNGNGSWKPITEPLPRITDEIIFKTSSDVDGTKITRIPQDEFIREYL